MKRIYEAILERILKESQSGDEPLAAFIHSYSWHGTGKVAVIYSTVELSKWLGLGYPDGMAAKRAVRGYVDVRRSEYPCNDAWEVKGSWGPGIGRIVYSLAFALTPNGRLMPDRDDVSDAASGSWLKASKKGLIAEPLDDIDHENCRPMGTHTPDESDDCPVHSDGRPWLDKSYVAGPLLGEYKRVMDDLTSRHGKDAQRLETELMSAAETAAWQAITSAFR